MGFQIKYYENLDSTNMEAMRLLDQNSKLHRLILQAAAQSQGKGRVGRIWDSPQGNSYSSYILNLEEDPFFQGSNLGYMGFIVSLSIMEVLISFGLKDKDFFCKWPNDLLYKGKKIAGILMETYVMNGKASHIIIGIGVNLQHFPYELKEKASSVFHEDHIKIEPSHYLERYISIFEKNLKKDPQLQLKKWASYSHKKGDCLKIRLPNEEFEGLFQAINGQGGLMIEIEGQSRTIYAGEVFAL